MAGTFSQIYIQTVFSPYGHENIIESQWRDELYKYIGGIIRNKGQKLIAINGMPNHVHIFFGFKPSMAVSDLVRDIKNKSTNFINEKGFVKGKFKWQDGFGSFSYGHSQIDAVYKYIMNQQDHHKKISFKEEYLELLKKFEIDFDEKYLFDWLE